MRTTRYFALAFSLIAVQSQATPSLCTGEETTEWSCTAHGKIYSLCTSKNIDAHIGYMQYRVGTKSKMEFVFPEALRHPKGAFHYGLLPHGAALDFANGPYQYEISETIGPGGETTLIDVNKASGGSLGTVTCSKSATYTLTLTTTLNRFTRFGIAE